MGLDAIIVLAVIILAIILFITEIIPIEITALSLIVILVFTGVLTPEQGIEGFSNSATVTVMFMFVLSAAIIKTGVLQYLGPRLAPIFRNHFTIGVMLMMITVAVISAFLNNTPIVAVFMPIMIQAAYGSGHSPSKLLIPLSYATILGGTCTLIGTSTNIVVSGIIEKTGLPAIGMFDFTIIGLIFVVTGMLYMYFIGLKLLPDRDKQKSSDENVNIHRYITEIELLSNSSEIGKPIMNSTLIKEIEMDILELRRGESVFNLPQGDIILEEGDILKVICDVNKISRLKDIEKMQHEPSIKLGEADMKEKSLTLVEMLVTPNSNFEGQTLRELDFRRHFRAVPLAIRHRNDISYQNLHDVPLRSGDIILAEVKKHYVKKIKEMQSEASSPFILISELGLADFNKKRFMAALFIALAVIVSVSFELANITTATIAGVIALVVIKSMTTKEMINAISWNVVFLLAGALSLGKAMDVSGLDDIIASNIISHLGIYGPIALLSGLYLTTSILTEIMSNNATAALLTPVAVSIAAQMDVSYLPFVMAILFGASASFSTPIGYQTNTMIYAAGGYKFSDYLRVGVGLNIILWIVATIAIPIFFPF